MKNVLHALSAHCGGDAEKMLHVAGLLLIACMNHEDLRTVNIRKKGENGCRLIARITDNMALMTNERWTPAEDEFLSTKCKEMSVKDLATALGRSVEAIRVRASTRGLRLLRGDTLDLTEYLCIHAGAKTVKAMAEELGVSSHQVITRLKRLRLPTSAVYTKWADSQYKHVEEMRANGMTYEAIALELDVSTSTLTAKMRRYYADK